MVEIRSFDRDDPLVEQFEQLTRQLYAGDPYYRTHSVSIPRAYAPQLFLALREGEIVGRIAALNNSELTFKAEKTGLFGYFDFFKDSEAARLLLEAACDHLRSKGCVRCVGPMNGNTWQSYRVTLRDENPPLFLDNYHKKYYHDFYLEQPLEEIASYITTRIPRDKFSFGRVDNLAENVEAQGITVRSLNLNDYEAELHRIHTISRNSFAQNLLYTPISLQEFNLLYLQIRDMVDPQFVLLAEHGRDPVAFIFALRDPHNSTAKSLLIKTLAVVPNHQSYGLGGYLTQLLHQKAHNGGVDQVFHLLMHSSNVSTKISASASEIYRRYALFGMHL